MNFSRWLAEQGLEHHAKAFAKSGIAGDILRELTDADLKELGLNLGDRRRFLKAIAALDAGPTQRRIPAAEPIAAPSVPRKPERRQLTVLFCDLVGSTELAARLDPEDLREVIRGYHEEVAAAVEHFEGHVAKYLGDGVVVYFGWPRAHEDDAERAVRAGLELVARVGRPRSGSEAALRARVGVATGLAVVGDLIGEGAAREESVIGETPALAARLQVLAGPGGVVISAATRGLVGGLFELEDFGPQQLKGFAKPVSVWRVLGEGSAVDRFEALRGAQRTPFVGREEELRLLHDRWALAREGHGQVVLLTGEAGIGKSRLTRTLQHSLADEAHLIDDHHCSPYHASSALYPVITRLERAAGLALEDQPETKVRKLEALLGQCADQADEAVPLVATLLGVAAHAHHPKPDLSPQRQKQRTLEVLLEHLSSLAQARPVLQLFEDVHWVDPSTLEFLDLLVERARSLRVLVVVTYRPEFEAPWLERPHVTLLRLERLERSQSAAIVESVSGGAVLPSQVRDEILAGTDGVPLFVEEVTKSVMESAVFQRGRRAVRFGQRIPIPLTLHDSLLARLDRLHAAKDLAQAAACIGRDFTFDLLAAIYPLPDDALRSALDRLLAAGLIFRREAAQEMSFSFKHALVREVAYGSLLKVRRRDLHRAIAAALESHCPAIAASQPEVLAHHFAEGGSADRAIDYWRQAAHRAMQRSAIVEVINHTRAALDLVETLPDPVKRVQIEIELQAMRGNALQTLKGWGAEETGDAFSRAHELCRGVGASPQVLRVLYGIYVFHLSRAEYQSARKLAENFLHGAETLRSTSLVAVGHRLLASTTCLMGNPTAARDELKSGLELNASDRAPSSAATLGMDQKSGSLGWLSLALLTLGFPDAALEAAEGGLAHASALNHLPSLAFALSFAGLVRYERGEYDAVLRHAECLEALSTEQGLTLHLATARILRGASLTTVSDARAGLDDLHAGANGWWSVGQMMLRPYYMAMMARAHVTLGEIGAACSTLEDARHAVESTGERWFEAEVCRRQGEVQRARHLPESKWGTCFSQAVRVARAQSAKMWELRATMDLARLHADRGERRKAYDLLAPVYGWFTEGFDIADLKDAKALLDELT